MGLTRQAAVERTDLLHPAFGRGRQLLRLGVHLLAKPPALPVHLVQPPTEVIHLLLLNSFDGVKGGEMVGLEPAQARQLPLGLLRLDGRSLDRLLALGALRSGGAKVLLQLRDPGSSCCKPAKQSRQPDNPKEEDHRKERNLTSGSLQLAGHVGTLAFRLVVAGHKPVV